MTEKMVPPPLPNAGSATPPPLPKTGAMPPPLPVERASPPPLPTTNAAPPPLPKAESAPPPIPSVAVASPPPVPAQKSEPPPVPTVAVAPEAPKVTVPPVPPVQIEASSAANTSEAAAVQPAANMAQQPASASTSGKSISTGAKLGISVAAVAVLAGVGYGMFGGKGADVPRSEKQAAAPASAPAPTVAPVAPAPIPNASNEKDDKIRQLEAKLAATEAEKQRALQAAEQRKSSERPATSTSTSRSAPAPVAPMPVPAAAPAPAPAVQYQPPQHSGVTYRADSRAQGQSCNTHSDCQGELKCNSGQCVANAGGVVQVSVPVPKNAKHLVGAFYLFTDSVKDLGNGYRAVYSYLNADVAVGNQYHGQVRSQVARYVMNCQTAQYGYDQMYFFSQLHAQGQRIAAQEWQPNQVAFNPIQNAEEYIRKSYAYACRK